MSTQFSVNSGQQVAHINYQFAIFQSTSNEQKMYKEYEMVSKTSFVAFNLYENGLGLDILQKA